MDGLVSKSENSQTIFRAYARTQFFNESFFMFLFVSEARNCIQIQENVLEKNSEIVSKTAFKTWDLSQLRDSHLSGNSVSVRRS